MPTEPEIIPVPVPESGDYALILLKRHLAGAEQGIIEAEQEYARLSDLVLSWGNRAAQLRLEKVSLEAAIEYLTPPVGDVDEDDLEEW